MIAADRVAVAVAARHHDREIGPRHLQPGGKRERSPVNAVESVAVGVGRDARRAADSGDDGNLLGGHAQLGKCARERHQNVVVPTTRTPDRLEVGSIIARFAGELGVGGQYHCVHSVIAWWISLGRMGKGPGRCSTLISPGKSYWALR